MRHRNFKDFTKGDLIRYYHDNYEDYTRSELHAEDLYFYNLLRDRGLIEKLILTSYHRGPYGNRSNEELLEIYHKKYSKQTRGTKKFKRTALFHALFARGILDGIPTLIDIGSRSNWKDMSIKELEEYYHKHHRKKTPNEVSKDDHPFYKHLSRIKKIHQIIKN